MLILGLKGVFAATLESGLYGEMAFPTSYGENPCTPLHGCIHVTNTQLVKTLLTRIGSFLHSL